MSLYRFPTPTLASGNPQAAGNRIHRSSGACPGPIWGARQRPKMNPIFPRYVRIQITYGFIARSLQNLISLKNKELGNLGGKREGTQGAPRNEGMSHDVIDNTCRKNVGLCPATMLMKNKGVSLFLPRYYRKDG